MDDHVKIARAMKTLGGSFVQALGEAIMLADKDNLRRLKEAFPEYWQLYKKHAQTLDERR